MKNLFPINHSKTILFFVKIILLLVYATPSFAKYEWSPSVTVPSHPDISFRAKYDYYNESSSPYNHVWNIEITNNSSKMLGISWRVTGPAEAFSGFNARDSYIKPGSRITSLSNFTKSSPENGVIIWFGKITWDGAPEENQTQPFSVRSFNNSSSSGSGLGSGSGSGSGSGFNYEYTPPTSGINVKFDSWGIVGNAGTKIISSTNRLFEIKNYNGIELENIEISTSSYRYQPFKEHYLDPTPPTVDDTSGAWLEIENIPVTIAANSSGEFSIKLNTDIIKEKPAGEYNAVVLVSVLGGRYSRNVFVKLTINKGLNVSYSAHCSEGYDYNWSSVPKQLVNNWRHHISDNEPGLSHHDMAWFRIIDGVGPLKVTSTVPWLTFIKATRDDLIHDVCADFEWGNAPEVVFERENELGFNIAATLHPSFADLPAGEYKATVNFYEEATDSNFSFDIPIKLTRAPELIVEEFMPDDRRVTFVDTALMQYDYQITNRGSEKVDLTFDVDHDYFELDKEKLEINPEETATLTVAFNNKNLEKNETLIKKLEHEKQVTYAGNSITGEIIEIVHEEPIDYSRVNYPLGFTIISNEDYGLDPLSVPVNLLNTNPLEFVVPVPLGQGRKDTFYGGWNYTIREKLNIDEIKEQKRVVFSHVKLPMDDLVIESESDWIEFGKSEVNAFPESKRYGTQSFTFTFKVNENYHKLALGHHKAIIKFKHVDGTLLDEAFINFDIIENPDSQEIKTPISNAPEDKQVEDSGTASDVESGADDEEGRGASLNIVTILLLLTLCALFRKQRSKDVETLIEKQLLIKKLL